MASVNTIGPSVDTLQRRKRSSKTPERVVIGRSRFYRAWMGSLHCRRASCASMTVASSKLGKSTLCLSTAGRFNLDCYVLNISDIGARSLNTLFAELPSSCVLLFLSDYRYWSPPGSMLCRSSAPSTDGGSRPRPESQPSHHRYIRTTMQRSGIASLGLTRTGPNILSALKEVVRR